ncbi:MAG: DUF1624 domain-containing protein [Ruminococcus sp.]|nr:DUF1624 domain-containing protein [Ruminococcus sp.]
MSNTQKQNSQRYNLIDSIRGLAIINMVAFHLLYDLFGIYNFQDKSNWIYQPATIIWERAISITFIIIAGICVNFSKQAVKRGILLIMCGILITAVTSYIMPEQIIRFGILSFLGMSVIITRLLQNQLSKIPPFCGFVISIILYLATFGIPNHYIGIFDKPLLQLPDFLYSINGLEFLGFRTPEFFSTDYFPLLPHYFIFVAGFYLWKIVLKYKPLRNLFKIKIPILNVIGKYSLIIYLLHQVIITLICMYIFEGTITLF